MLILSVLLGALVGALANRFAGWEHGNRYLPAAVLWLVLFAFGGWAATVFALAFLFWRAIGWYKSIDMGRNEGTVLGDFAKLVGISLLPVATIAIMYPTPWLLLLAFTPPIVYYAVMRGLPWEPQYRHIATAEYITGAFLGAGAVLVLSQ